MRARLCALILACGAAPAAAEDPAPLDAALAALEAGHYTEVVEQAGRVPADAADYPRWQYLLGEAQAARRDFAAAETAFRTVLAARPAALPAQLGLGRALAAQAKHTEAESVLRAAFGAHKRDPQAQRALGEFLTGTDRAAEALPLLEAAFKQSPKDPYAARALVAALLATDGAKRALAVATKLATEQPDHPMGHFLRGWVLDRTDQDAAAIAAYERAVACDDTFLDAHKNLAILCHGKNPMYRDRERTLKFIAHYKAYFAQGGDDPKLRQVWESVKSFLPRFFPDLADALK